jgi:tripartite-type tricarboxylate transporter receptor subunit TctC
VGRGQACTSLDECPLPSPPPQAGEGTHRTCRAIIGSCLAVVALFALSSVPAHAQDAVADFYRGKQIRFIIRAAPGGGFDLYSRLLGRHIVRHIPGNPTVLPQNMPGAGGITAANYVAEIAPRDGTVLTMTGQAIALDQALGFTPSLKADLRSFGWIGNISDSNLLTYVWHASPTKTMADARARETTLGAVGAGDLSSWIPFVYNRVLGTRFKIIGGYQSGSEIKLAMERGEVEGFGANPYSALLSAQPQVVKDKLVTILVQIGPRRDPALPDVPLLSELAPTPADRQVLDFITKGLAVGRPVGTTQGVPAERVAALRRAFDATLADPEFIADAQKQGADIGPMNGAAVQQLIEDVLGAAPELKDRAKAVMPPR